MNITITLTRYDEPDELVKTVMQSLSQQKDIHAVVLFLDQKDSPALKKFCNELTSDAISFEYINIPEISLSYARNFAIKMCKTDIILFIDTDAIAEQDWAYHLCESLNRDGVAVAGGKILPKWHLSPLMITKSSFISEQYSIFDYGDEEIEITKVIGASFGLNLNLLGKEAYFHTSLGRRGGMLLGGEEIDVCMRAIKIGFKVIYNGKSTIFHQILPERISYKWIIRRMYYAGISRAMRGGVPTPTHSSTTFWNYFLLPIILVPYLIGYLREKMFHTHSI